MGISCNKRTFAIIFNGIRIILGLDDIDLIDAIYVMEGKSARSNKV